MRFSDLASPLFLGLMLGASATQALAQKAPAKEIVIGHVAGYTGPVTKDATEMGAGAQVYSRTSTSRVISRRS